MAQDGSETPRLQEGLREPKTTSKMAQDPKITQDASITQDGSQDIPRGPKTAPRRAQVATEPPQEAAKRPITFKHFKEISEFCHIAFSLLMAFRGLKRLQDSPIEAQESPKTAPGPKRAQERSDSAPKSAPRGALWGSGGAKQLMQAPPFFDR
eukprot:2828750-Pyramimonas_sp.AAC.1